MPPTEVQPAPLLLSPSMTHEIEKQLLVHLSTIHQGEVGMWDPPLAELPLATQMSSEVGRNVGGCVRWWRRWLW